MSLFGSRRFIFNKESFFFYCEINYYFFINPIFIVVSQPYEAEADNEYVIRGNSAIMKCEVPSFVADFVSVEMWMDSDGNTFYPNSDYGNSLSVILSY